MSGTFIGSRGVPSLNPSGTSTAVTTITLPAGTGGSYWVLACANSGYGTFTEITTANNCLSSPITIAAPDLAESGVTATSTAVSGGAIQVTDTVTNNVVVVPPSASATCSISRLPQLHRVELTWVASASPVYFRFQHPGINVHHFAFEHQWDQPHCGLRQFGLRRIHREH